MQSSDLVPGTACRQVKRLPLQVAVRAVASLMALEAINPKEDVRIYINSAGKSNHLTATFSIATLHIACFCAYTEGGILVPAGGAPYHVISLLDTIQALRINVSTVTLGISASTATLLLVRLLSLHPCLATHQVCAADRVR